MADPIDDYLKSISPYTRPPTEEEAKATAPTTPAAPSSAGDMAYRFARDIGVFGGNLAPGAANLLAVPGRIGYGLAGKDEPSWLNEGNIENTLVPAGLQARNPEEQRYAAAGRGVGAALPLAAFPPTRPYAVPAALGGGAGGYFGEMAQQAFPNQPWVGPAVGATVGMAGGMTPGIGGLLRDPGATLGALRRGMGAIDLGYLRSIALEHSAPALGKSIGETLGVPGLGPAIGGLIHWGPVIAPPIYNTAKRILGAAGAIPGAVFGAGAGSTADPSTLTPPM
jgi:hypothetical protein